MVHRRVSYDADHADLRGSYPGILCALLCKRLKRFPDACGKRPRAVCLRVFNARNNIRAILRLRVQTAPLRQKRAAYAIAQAADDRRCAKVNGERICRLSVRFQRRRLSGRENFSRMARGKRQASSLCSLRLAGEHLFPVYQDTAFAAASVPAAGRVEKNTVVLQRLHPTSLRVCMQRFRFACNGKCNLTHNKSPESAIPTGREFFGLWVLYRRAQKLRPAEYLRNIPAEGEGMKEAGISKWRTTESSMTPAPMAKEIFANQRTAVSLRCAPWQAFSQPDRRKPRRAYRRRRQSRRKIPA